MNLPLDHALMGRAKIPPMATQDKTDFARAAGAVSEWHGFPFEGLESGTGSAFYAEPTQRAVRTAYATYVFPLVGEPQLRGIIERVFGTFRDRPMPFIPGRTFSNTQQRGDYNTEGLAVLTDDQLALIFIRYIVDVYHHSKHRGPGGETPAAALARLGGTYGVPPKPSQKARRRAFGSREERTVTARGIQFLGTFDQMRALRQLHLLPSFPARKGHGYRSTKSISKTVLSGFLRKYQTIVTAARHLEFEQKELRSRIEKTGIVFAQEGVGLPIFYRSDLLN